MPSGSGLAVPQSAAPTVEDLPAIQKVLLYGNFTGDML